MFEATRRGFLQGIGGAIVVGGLGACGRGSAGSGSSTATVDVAGLDAAGAERARAEVRRAIGLLLDREYVCREIARADQAPANTLVCRGVQEPDGSDFAYNAGAGGGRGYFDPTDEALPANYEEALAVLKRYYDYDEARRVITNFPALTYLYNNGDAHRAIGEYVQSALGAVGIRVSLENQEWATFLHTRANGDYDVARSGWYMDYTDPVCMLDAWTTQSGNNEQQFGRGDHADVAAYDLDLTGYGLETRVEGGTWAETYDVLIDAIKAERDQERRFALMHLAEDMVMSTGAVCPLYYYTDPYMIKKGVEGFMATTLGMYNFGGCTVDGARDSISVCYGSEPDTLDPNLCNSNESATTIWHLFAGLTRWAERDDGAFEIVPDCAERLAQGSVNDDGTVTYSYTLRKGLTWSDGEPLTAHDFEYAWRRTASEDSGSAYSELFKAVAGYPDDLAVTAKDELTLEVTCTGPVGYWDQLLAFPAFFPVRENVVASERWATDPTTLVCNGAYTVAGWEHNSLITLARRDGYWDADRIKMREIKVFLSDDANTCLRNWEDGDWQFINEVPTNEVARVRRQYPGEYVVAPLAGTYYLSWNVNRNILPA